MSKLRPYQLVRARVCIRTDLPFPIKEECIETEGLEADFEVYWQIEDDHSRYPGEWALMPTHREMERLRDAWPIGWIASGDLQILGPAHGPRMPDRD